MRSENEWSGPPGDRVAPRANSISSARRSAVPVPSVAPQADLQPATFPRPRRSGRSASSTPTTRSSSHSIVIRSSQRHTVIIQLSLPHTVTSPCRTLLRCAHSSLLTRHDPVHPLMLHHDKPRMVPRVAPRSLVTAPPATPPHRPPFIRAVDSHYMHDLLQRMRCGQCSEQCRSCISQSFQQSLPSLCRCSALVQISSTSTCCTRDWA